MTKHTITAIALYAAIPLLFLWGIHGHITTTMIAAPGPDPKQWPWFLAWWPYAINHWTNPFYTHAIWNPNGETIAWATSTPLLAILIAPITALAKPIAAYNIMTMATMAANATAARNLTIATGTPPGRSTLAGLLIAYSPFFMAELMGRPNIFTMWPTLTMAALYIQHARRQIPPTRYRWDMAIMATAQAYICIETMVTTCLIGALSIITAYIIHPPTRNRIRQTIKHTAQAAAITTAATLPLVITMLLAPHNHHPFFRPEWASADLTSFIIPSPLTWLGGRALQLLTIQDKCIMWEQDAYIGIPLLAITTYLIIRCRHTATARIGTLTITIPAILSLGPTLEILGSNTHITMPFSILLHIPLLQQITPTRLTMYSTIATIITCARLWPNHAPRWKQLAAAATIITTLCPTLTHNYWHHTPDNPTFFTTNEYHHYLHHGQNILILPEQSSGNGPLFQAEDNFYWNNAAGWLGRATPHGHYYQRITANTIRPWLTAHNCRTVIVPLKWQRRERRITAQLVPAASTGGVQIFKVFQDTQ